MDAFCEPWRKFTRILGFYAVMWLVGAAVGFGLGFDVLLILMLFGVLPMAFDWVVDWVYEVDRHETAA